MQTGLRILVVDDCTAIRGYIRKQLKTAQVDCHEILEAEDGRKALGLMQEVMRDGAALDLIVSDINMPVMDGEQFVASIRGNPLFDAIPILIFSSDSSQSRILRLRQLGVQGYITKPCEPALLRLRVQKAIEDLKKQNQQEKKNQQAPAKQKTHLAEQKPQSDPANDQKPPVEVIAKSSILLIEASESERNRIHKALQKLGFPCRNASNADEALAELRINVPDLVLLDVVLQSENDGISLGQTILSEFGMPVIYLGDCEDALIDLAHSTNPYGYVLKPPTEPCLKAAVRAAECKKNARHANQASFHTVADSLEDAVFVSNADGHLVYINPAAEKLRGKVSGLPLTDALPLYSLSGKPLTSELLDDTSDGISASVNGGVALMESTDGTKLSVHYQVVPLPKVSNHFSGITVSIVCSDEEAPAPYAEEIPDAKKSVSPRPLSETSTPKHEEALHLATRNLQSRLDGGHSQCVAVLFVLDRFHYYEKRYGQSSVSICKMQYLIYLADKAQSEDEIFDWGDNAFLVLMNRPWTEEELRREVAMIACKRIEPKMHAGTDPATMMLTATWAIFPLSRYSNAALLAEEIEQFRVRKGS